MGASQRGSRVPAGGPPQYSTTLHSRPVPGAAVGDLEKPTGTRAGGAGCGGSGAEARRPRRRSKEQWTLRRSCGSRSCSLCSQNDERSFTPIFLKFVDVVTAASLRRCQPKRHTYPMRSKRHVTILHPGNLVFLTLSEPPPFHPDLGPLRRHQNAALKRINLESPLCEAYGM